MKNMRLLALGEKQRIRPIWNIIAFLMYAGIHGKAFSFTIEGSIFYAAIAHVSRRAMLGDLKELEEKYLVSHSHDLGDYPQDDDFSKITSVVFEPSNPWEIRVKYSLLLARICQRYPSVYLQCEITGSLLSKMKTKKKQARVLNGYLKNFGLHSKNSEPHHLAENEMERP